MPQRNQRHMHHRLLKLPMTAALWLMASAALAQGEGVISINERVTGNQEQPKVIYIVPWQSAEGPLGVEGPVQSLLGEEVFGHVEKAEHAREVRYLTRLGEQATAAD